MRGNSHVRFGGRAEETGGPKGQHRASVRPNHTNATLAAESGASLRSLMARLGHAAAAAAIRYQHKLEGQDAKIADFLDEIGRAALPPREESAG
ncbi:MAG TPA: hypothetical protein VMZ51_04380 [Acidimicrobiales bacterium]|nr:hypothetical protein [Acidimicrobiales bacterium]